MSRLATLKRRGIQVLIFTSLLGLPACGEANSKVLAVAATGTFLDAARIAVADELELGPISGFDTILVEEVSNRSGPALEIARDLVEVPGLLAVVGHSNSTASLAASQFYNRRGVVQIAPTSTAPIYSDAGAFSFRMVPPDDVQARSLVRNLEEALPPGSRTAVLYVNDDYGRALRAAVLKELDTEAFPVVVDLPHAEGEVEEVDVGHIVEALGAAEVDVVLWLARTPALNLLLPVLREAKGDVPVFGGDAISRVWFVSGRGSWWEGVRYLDFVDMDATEELRSFSERFRAIHGVPAGGAEALTYDAVRLLLATVREGADSGEAVREYLMSLGRGRDPFPGITGPLVFSEAGDAEREYVMLAIGPEEGT